MSHLGSLSNVNSSSVGIGNGSNGGANTGVYNIGAGIGNCGGNGVILQTLKRRANKASVPLDERVTLERVYGLTSTSNSRLAQSADGTIAYLAGCVIVLYYPGKQANNDFIISSARKTLTTVGFSIDGRYIATGESGHDPRVRVWDVKDKVQIAEFAGHKFSIECVYFSPNLSSNLLVSIGSQHDMVVNVWNIKTRFKAASNKISCKVKGMSFSRDASYFVTVGNRHVKFWYLTTSSLMETVPLKGRAAILGEYKNYYFCDVVCGSDDCAHLTYALTTNGILCEFNENRYLSRAVDLNTEYAYCLYADNFSLFVGCSNGNIHLFRQKNLDLVSCLPRPHYLGVDISQVKDTSHVIQTAHNTDLKYPDCVALAYNRHTHLVTAVYNDHSMYTWDIADLTKVKKIDSHLFHSASCSALDIYPNNPNANKLPYNSFITCSTDNTLRIWSSVSQPTAPNQAKLRSKLGSANIYSSQLLKIIYIENDLSALCDIDQSLMVSGNQWDGVDNGNNISSNVSSNIQQQQVTSIPMGSINNINMLSSTATGTGTATNGTGNSNEQTMANSSNKLGARCLKISPIGNHLATGDRNGNIKIFDLDNLDMIGTIEAHDCEILCLQYSQVECGKLLLASSSRDRLIHIFDATSSAYTPIQTIDDHSSSISALRFCYNRADQQLHLISCGNDKSIMVRTMSTTNTGGSHSSSDCSNQFQRSSYAVEKQTFYDLNVDNSNACINTISQDRMVRTYSIKDGKRVRQFRGSLNEDGHLIKMDTDRTGCLIAASCTDKCVYIWDLSTCECVGYIYGHAEVVADLKFTWDNQHLITVSGDGCVFVWRLNSLINNSSNRAIANTSTNSNSNSKQQSNSQSTHAVEAMFDQSEQLPAWAKNKLNKMDEPVEQQQQQEQSARRSRAVWGPPVNDTSFAVMSESEMNSMSLNDDDDNANQIEFPSPCVDKMDTSSWPTISEDVDVDSEARLSSTVCANLTFRRNECQNGLFSSPSALHFNSDFSKILNPSPNPPRTPANRLDADSDSALRRQSLSARYLMKTAANPTQTQTPVLAAAVPRTIDECSDDAERSDATKKKTLCTHHTESSLNKTRSKSTVKRSPSVSSLSNESRSSIASCSQKSKSTSAKSSPQRLNDDGYLKKAVSMVSLDAKPSNTGKKNLLAGPKTLRQIKQRATATSTGGGSVTAGGQQPVRPVAPATTFYEQNKHLRKLSTSIQNITNSGLSLLHAPGSNLPPQAPRTCAKSAQFELSPKKSEMLSSSSSSASSHHNNDNDNDEAANLRESSLSSSSSSSCSIYDQAVQMDNECDIKKKLVHSLINNVGKVPYLLNRSADFCQQSNTTNVKMNSLSLNSSPIGHNYSTLKKPTTFASLAAAASHSNNIILNSSTNTTNTQTTNTTNTSSLTQKPNLSSDKIESILYEFKQNMFILDLIYDQVSSNIDEYKKLQHTANLIQTTHTCGQSQIASAQTLQIIQTFNTSIYSIVKQFKTMLASQSTPLNNASQSNTSQSLETNKIDTDLEYV